VPPRLATRMPLNEIESLSRSAGSPALPTAITTRSQLASSPAIAVFTSGEFATDMAIPAPRLSTPHRRQYLDQLARAFAEYRRESFFKTALHWNAARSVQGILMSAHKENGPRSGR
jgi:hypothetical protein